MEKTERWSESVERIVNHYLSLGDGGFDENMKAHYVACDEEEKSITIEFATQHWQINERGGIHGGAIAGMFDTGFGIIANFIAGKDEATTVDMNISFMRPIALGENCKLTVYVVKAGARIIRLRADLFCVETGKLTATGSGSWMPL